MPGIKILYDNTPAHKYELVQEHHTLENVDKSRELMSVDFFSCSHPLLEECSALAKPPRLPHSSVCYISPKLTAEDGMTKEVCANINPVGEDNVKHLIILILIENAPLRFNSFSRTKNIKHADVG